MQTERDVTTSNDTFVINKASETLVTTPKEMPEALCLKSVNLLYPNRNHYTMPDYSEKAVFMHIMRTKTSVTHNQLCTQQWRQALQIPSSLAFCYVI